MQRHAVLKRVARTAWVSLAICGFAHAADQGTAPEAEAMVKRAVAQIKRAGAEKAYDKFTSGKSFKDRDLNVIVYDLHRKNRAHGANPKLLGKDLIGLKNPDGRPLVQMLVDVAKTKGHGWTDTVKFRNPVTDKIQTRANSIERVGEVAIGSGFFKG